MIIIIPCYNEAERLHKDSFISFLNSKNENVRILFSNDGSTDTTLEKLEEIRKDAPNRVLIYNLEKNKGKSEAVRKAVLYCIDQQITFEQIAYLDADLSTSLEECYQMAIGTGRQVVFSFGSRILKIDNQIVRKPYRHYIGRVIATIISIVLKLTVYDTQCGCKVFNYPTAKVIFKERFISRWLFDVEIFYRIINMYGREQLHKKCKEIPLKAWMDHDGSKVSFRYFFRMWIDLVLIYQKYGSQKQEPQ